MVPSEFSRPLIPEQMSNPGASAPLSRDVEATYHEYDRAIRERLELASHADEEFWSFRGNAVREHGHGFFQYPAMTVPQMQRYLMETVRSVVRRVVRVYDPFLGSGTTMTEAMLQGLNFIGRDINPLAILVCHAKAESLETGDLESCASTVIQTAQRDTDTSWEIDFPGRQKWFKEDVAVELSRLRRAIRNQDCRAVRRFLWVALAETVRLTSNSRTSTFKLHIRPAAEIASREISPITVFRDTVSSNLKSLQDFKDLLATRRLLKRGAYRGAVNIALADTRAPLSREPYKQGFDLLITSPPYGDNGSTVPYGQHAYLPLQWMDAQDLDEAYDPSCLRTTLEIDRRSLGGIRRGALEEVGVARRQSPALDRTLQVLQDRPRDRAIRVAAFFRDLASTLDPALGSLRRNAYMIWTVGNRKVGGISIPMDEIMTELLVARGAVPVMSIRRAIPVKRMASKNSVSTTMRSETILILRKARP